MVVSYYERMIPLKVILISQSIVIPSWCLHVTRLCIIKYSAEHTELKVRIEREKQIFIKKAKVVTSLALIISVKQYMGSSSKTLSNRILLFRLIGR